MATYEREATGQTPPSSFRVAERHLYGSARLGIDATPYEFIATNYTTSPEAARSLGQKHYEISNHLGNVLSVITDQKLPVVDVSTVVSYAAVVLSATDYSPFGVGLYGRSWSEGYRYGFQGQAKDEELWHGAILFKYRIQDKRLGRFLSVDPLYKEYPWNSSYAFSENRLVDGVDLEGLEYVNVNAIVNNDGGTFLEVFGDVLSDEPLVERDGETYYHVDFDLYRTADGSLSFGYEPGNVPITEWFFDEAESSAEPSDWVSYGSTFNCNESARQTCSNAGAPVGPFDRNLQMFDNGGYNLTTEDSRRQGLYAIHKSIEKFGLPIMVGVNYSDGSPNPGTDNTTDHFVVIVGRGSDERGNYFTYYDNVGGQQAGTNTQINRFYLSDDGTLNAASGGAYLNDGEVTQVRPGKNNGQE